MENNLEADVLLVTVNDVETESLLATAKAKTGQDYVPWPVAQKTYFDLGVIGGARVFAVRSEMGSDTMGGSLITVKDAIAEVKPSSVIMVGIAFGVDASKQKIGDVLVAKQLQGYDLQRIGTSGTGDPKIILRGDKPHCSEKLLDRFRTARLRWKRAEVSFGLVLSGEKLIDNVDFRDQLRALSQEAIGGEMEGGGLYAASQQSKVDWILVKAICDWADGKKDVRRKKRQKIAADNSADFVFEMLAAGLLASDHQPLAQTINRVAEARPIDTRVLSADRISIARLPISGNELFGREDELKLLDDAWNNPNKNIVTFVAWGGVGKTALVNHWLKQVMARENYRGAECVLGESFFSQGTSERAASADLFIDRALRFFGDPDAAAGSPWDKGERLAMYIRQARTLLVLDGLEPLQHPPGAQEGRLKDAAMQALLVELAAHQPGLCLISTRERIGDLIEFENSTIVTHDLDYLSPQAGARILRSFGVKGDDDDLETASREMGGHAFSLTLLGSYLNEVLDGDIRRRNEIENLFDDARYGEKDRL
jgi:nucleoside phosphorylase